MRRGRRLAGGARPARLASRHLPALAAALALGLTALPIGKAQASNGPYQAPFPSSGEAVGDYDGQISTDGHTAVYRVDRRQFFNDVNGNDVGLFLYRDGEVTDLITKPPPFPETQESGGNINALSDDGSSVVFTTLVRQLPSDTDSGCDMYEYRHGSFSAVPGDCPDFLGLSADGSTMFIATDERLLASDTDDAADIYERRGDELRLVTAGTDPSFDGDLYPARVSPSGALAFETSERLLPFDTDDQRDVYVWRDGVLQMASRGASDSARAQLAAISDDGSTVVYGVDDLDGMPGPALYVSRAGTAESEVVNAYNYWPRDFDGLTPDGRHLFYYGATGLREHTPSGDVDVPVADGYEFVKTSDDGQRLLLRKIESLGADGTIHSQYAILDRGDDSLTPANDTNGAPGLLSASPSLDYVLFDLGGAGTSTPAPPPEEGPLQEFDDDTVTTLYPGLGRDIQVLDASADGRTTLIRTTAVLEPHDYLYPDFHTKDVYLRTPDGVARILTQRRLPLNTHLSVFDRTNREEFLAVFDSTQQASRFDCRYWRAGAKPPPYGNCFTDGYGHLQLENLKTGRYIVEGFATSISGEVDDTPVRKSVVVDRTPPKTRFTRFPRKIVPPGPVLFAMRSSEPRPQWKCRFDRGHWNSCSDRTTWNVTEQGRHIFQARARDFAGNWGPVAGYRFRVSAR